MNKNSDKYLTFQLGNEEYGIQIQNIKEIIALTDITFTPKTPIFIKGVINLRGKILPILDLRTKFGLAELQYTKRTCIIIVDLISNEQKKQIGVIVDKIYEVLNIEKDEIEEYNPGSEKTCDDFILGIGKVKDRVILILDAKSALGI